MWIKVFKLIFLVVFSASYGLVSAAGVFTVLIAVGLVPRFAGKTHTADRVILYEEMMIAGTIVGCIISVFNNECVQLAETLRCSLSEMCGIIQPVLKVTGWTVLFMSGLFSGMFVGCLALAIAEMLDSIPIFMRRVNLRKGIGIVVMSIAAGKFLASVFYFVMKLYNNLE
jgi:stage V sporulation protein AB